MKFRPDLSHLPFLEFLNPAHSLWTRERASGWGLFACLNLFCLSLVAMLGSLSGAVRTGCTRAQSKARPLSQSRLVSAKPEKPVVQKRGLRTDYYFHKYFPPTGVPTRPANEEPWDYMNRPKRRQGQLAKRLEKLISMNDYYTIFRPETIEPLPKPVITAPEPRSTI